MIELSTLSPTVRAVALVGAVFLEALVLYVGYGGLTRLVGPHLHNAIQEYS